MSTMDGSFSVRRISPGTASGLDGFAPSRRSRGRGLGLRSAPAALLGLCLGFLAFFVWAAVVALPQTARQIEGVAGGAGFEPTPAIMAAALAYMLGTPAVLFFVRRRYWRRMRTWLKRATMLVALLWAGMAGVSLLGAGI